MPWLQRIGQGLSGFACGWPTHRRTSHAVDELEPTDFALARRLRAVLTDSLTGWILKQLAAEQTRRTGHAEIPAFSFEP